MIGSGRSRRQARRIHDAKLLTLLTLFQTGSELRLVLLLEKRIVIGLRLFISSGDIRQLLFRFWRQIQTGLVSSDIRLNFLLLLLIILNLQAIGLELALNLHHGKG